MYMNINEARGNYVLGTIYYPVNILGMNLDLNGGDLPSIHQNIQPGEAPFSVHHPTRQKRSHPNHLSQCISGNYSG